MGKRESELDNILLIFIKNPILGKAKTRIAKTVGDIEALRIYKELLNHTREISLKTSAQKHLYYSHFIDDKDEWTNTEFQKFLQRGKGLGERMKHGFLSAFSSGNRVVIIGSDCPQINENILNKAFLLLEENDVVFGPSLDGGYYLLGMNSHYPELFEEIPWSTENVLELSLEKCKEMQLTTAFLPRLSDVDYIEDWKKYGW